MSQCDFLTTQEHRRSLRAQQSGTIHKILRRTSLSRIVGDLRRLQGAITQPKNVKIAGISLPIHHSFGPAVRAELYAGRYEQGEIELLSRYLEKSDRVLELGGGLGLLSAYSAKIVGSANVMVVEANPDMVPLIQDVYRANGVNPNLKNGAVSKKAGTMRFNIAADFWGSSTETLPNQCKTIEVVTYPLDNLIEEFHPTFIVCDIEGGEFELFTETSLQGVKSIIVEVHSNNLMEPKVERLFKRFAELKFNPIPHPGEPHVWFLMR